MKRYFHRLPQNQQYTVDCAMRMRSLTLNQKTLCPDCLLKTFFVQFLYDLRVHNEHSGVFFDYFIVKKHPTKKSRLITHKVDARPFHWELSS